MNTLSKLVLSLSLSCLPAMGQEPAPAAPPPVPVTKPTPEQPATPKVLQLGGRIAGDLQLLDIDGKPQRAEDLKGKVTVVNFYSIQCPIQAAWDQRLADIQKAFATQGVVFLHIDSNVSEIGEQPPAADAEGKPYDKVRVHLQKKQLPFRVLVDHGNKVADLFGATTTPHVYVFAADGRLVYRGLVDDDQRGNRAEERTNHLRDTLTQLVAGKPVEPFATKEVGCSIKRVGKGERGGRRPRGEGRGRDGGK